MPEQPSHLFASALGSGLRLALIGALVVACLAALHELTQPRIALNLQRAQVQLLIDLTGDDRLLGVPLEHPLPDQVVLCESGVPRYLLMTGRTQGYSGRIEFLVALDNRDRLLGVRVVQHTETPGLGDALETDKSDWIHQLAGLPRSASPRPDWGVAQDGGRFDAMTGATITSRAILDGVRQTLAQPDKTTTMPCIPLI